MRDFATETLSKNGIEPNLTTDTLSDPNSKTHDANFRVDTLISPISKIKNKAILNPYKNEVGISKISNNDETDHALTNPNEQNFIKFSDYFAPFFYNTFSNSHFFKSQFCIRFYQN